MAFIKDAEYDSSIEHMCPSVVGLEEFLHRRKCLDVFV